MTDLLNIWIGNQIVARGTVHSTKNRRGETTYSFQIEETIRMPEQTTTRRKRRQGRGRVLERLLDPERDFPILRQLFQTLAPILLDFLTTKLPALLAIQEPEEDDDTELV